MSHCFVAQRSQADIRPGRGADRLDRALPAHRPGLRRPHQGQGRDRHRRPGRLGPPLPLHAHLHHATTDGTTTPSPASPDDYRTMQISLVGMRGRPALIPEAEDMASGLAAHRSRDEPLHEHCGEMDSGAGCFEGFGHGDRLSAVAARIASSTGARDATPRPVHAHRLPPRAVRPLSRTGGKRSGHHTADWLCTRRRAASDSGLDGTAPVDPARLFLT